VGEKGAGRREFDAEGVERMECGEGMSPPHWGGDWGDLPENFLNFSFEMP